MPASTRPDATSKLVRVRLRVTKLMRFAHDEGAAQAPAVECERHPLAAEADRAAAERARLTEDLGKLQLIMEDTEKLVRDGWEVAVTLNQIRRQCRRCEEASGLSEAIGFYQGLLNQCRHNVQAATRAIASIRTLTTPRGVREVACVPALCPGDRSGGQEAAMRRTAAATTGR